MILRLLAGSLLMATPAAAFAEWHEASSAHFVVYSNDEPERLKAFATKLERFDKAVRVLRGLDDPPVGRANRLTVYVVGDTDAVQKLVGRGGDGVAGFYIPRAEGSVAFVPRRMSTSGADDLNADTVFFHEYTHHLMLGNMVGALPAWYVEGYAEFHASARFQPDGSVWLGASGAYRNYGLGASRGKALDRMFEGDMARMTAVDVDAFYGRGWVLTHMLTFDPARKGQLGRYLREMNNGMSSMDAAKLAFGDLKALRRDLDLYMSRPKLDYIAIPAAKLTTGPITVRALRPGEAAFLPIRMRSTRGVDKKSAPALVGNARRIGTRYPNDVDVQGMLAEVELDAGNLAQAEAAAQRALAVDPKNGQALIYMGRTKMAQASLAKATDPKIWRDARRWFVEASRVDADDPEPKVLFHQSFVAANEKPSRNAIDALIYAQELAPQDLGLRFRVGRQHLVDGKLKEARIAIAAVAWNPHAGPLAKRASAVIAKIDAGDAAGALAAWDEGMPVS